MKKILIRFKSAPWYGKIAFLVASPFAAAIFLVLVPIFAFVLCAMWWGIIVHDQD